MSSSMPLSSGFADKLRVLLVEDHPLTRKGMVDLLHAQYLDIQCQECRTFQEAVEHLKENWDLVILDQLLPDGTGIDLLEHVGTSPALMLTMYEDSVLAYQARERGAKGFASKGDNPQVLIQAIRKVLSGLPHFPILAGSPVSRNLSARERLVLEGLLQGQGSQKIATQLGLSHSSVQTYKSRLFKKLGVDSLSELLRSATAKGLH
jgi:DNA-binding NarL/FixJ family response regulator